MHPTNAMLMARQMLDEQGLTALGWSFKINSNKRRCGVCNPAKRRIEVSKYRLLDGEEHVKETLAHEVAHAVVGCHNGHNHVWRSKALELGSLGTRCVDGMHNVEYKWQSVCPNCGVVGLKHRRPKKFFSCRRCSNGVFNFAFLLQYRPNHAGLTAKDITR